MVDICWNIMRKIGGYEIRIPKIYEGEIKAEWISD
jgi:hypothetical protein